MMMKYFLQITNQHQRIFTVLVFISILSLSAGVTLGCQTSVAPTDSPTTGVPEKNAESPSNSLPSAVTDTVLQTASQLTSLPIAQLKIVKHSQIQGSSSCLGVPLADEACTEDLVPIWQITVEGGQQNLVYHSNLDGSQIRFNKEASNLTDAELPNAIAQAVLQEASKQSILPIDQLQVTQAQQQTWPDGCLGISSPDTFCTQALVPGWRVIVKDQEQSFIYRTNDSGSVVKLEKTAAQLPTESSLPDTVILAVQIPQRELPLPLAQDTIFRVITSGGFTGRTYKTTLLKDGQVMRVLMNFNGSAGSSQASRISSQEVQQFQQLLEKVDFAQFNQLSYPPPIGAADYVTVVMTSQTGTTSYADMVQHQLPESLKTVIQAWNQIAKF
ncbi:MAG: hypothetical protein F6K31_24545 [Symploca sp. SIO2G7]|nr:hypothetical protein [Symploca sp. SIO2G7]